MYYLGMALLAALSIRPVAALTISDVVFFGSLVATAISLPGLRGRSRTVLPVPLLYGVLLFAVGGAFSSFAAFRTGTSLVVGAKLVYLTLVWFWLGGTLLTTVRQISVAQSMWIGSIAACGLAALGQLFLRDLGLAPSGSGRPVGLAEHPNDLGGIAAVGLVPAVTMTVRPGVGLCHRVMAALLLGCVASALVLSGSVGALLAVFGGLGVWIALARTEKRYVTVALVVIIAVVVWLSSQEAANSYAPISRIPAVTGTGSVPATLTFESRLATDGNALRTVIRNPILGIGLDGNNTTDQLGDYVHNMFLGAWLAGGLPSLVGLLIVVTSVSTTAVSVIRNADSPQERLIAVSLGAAFITFLLFAMSEPVLYVRYGWVVAALLLAMSNVQRRRARDSEAT